MASDSAFVDWLNLRTQEHWYELRHEFESEILDATKETRRDFDVSVRLNTATIVTDGDRSALRVPVTASWRDALDQCVASLLVFSTEENEPRISAIAAGISDLLYRWVEREVPVSASPEFCYPQSEVRWPPEPESADETAKKVEATAGASAAPAAAAAATVPAPVAAGASEERAGDEAPGS